MLDTGDLQVVSIERLVDHSRVGAISQARINAVEMVRGAHHMAIRVMFVLKLQWIWVGGLDFAAQTSY